MKINFIAKVRTKDLEAQNFFEKYSAKIQFLSGISAFELLTQDQSDALALDTSRMDAAIVLDRPNIEIKIDLKGLVNFEEEAKRLRKEIEKLNADLLHVKTKLSKESFILKAPKELVDKERQNEVSTAQKIKDLEIALQKITKS